MSAPHSITALKRDDFLSWLERHGATLVEATNPYEVLRYRMWIASDKSRPSTHIIYKRGNGSLTYSANTAGTRLQAAVKSLTLPA